MEQHQRHSCCTERVANTVAAIQLRRLQARTRTEDGGAAKERLRVQPGLPWRLRAKGAKRARPPPEEVQFLSSGCKAPCCRRFSADEGGRLAGIGSCQRCCSR